MTKYLKAALLNGWNLLALVAGIGVAYLTRPDVGLCFLAAAEVAYLGLLGMHPGFQKYVDAKAAKGQRGCSTEQAMRRMLRELPRESEDRYDQLQQRCTELRDIAADMRRTVDYPLSSSLASLQREGLDRLLWTFLRLLFTQHSLGRFLDKTDSQVIRNEIDRFRHRLSSLGEGRSRHVKKLRRILEDNIKTCEDRLVNYQKALDNHEFIGLEIDRLEHKIKSVAEVAVNRREEDFISGQLDEVTQSIVDTEVTIDELDFATGLGSVNQQVPAILKPLERV